MKKTVYYITNNKIQKGEILSVVVKCRRGDYDRRHLENIEAIWFTEEEAKKVLKGDLEEEARKLTKMVANI